MDPVNCLLQLPPRPQFLTAASLPDRIINGHIAAHGQFPHQVSLMYNRNSSHFCGGSILDAHWILTAAHCFRTMDPERYSKVAISIGSLRWRQGQMHTTEQIIIHEEYNKSRVYRHDIALVRVVEAIVFNDTVHPIPLNRKFIPDEARVVQSGWGRYIPGVAKSSEELRFIEYRTLSITGCYCYQLKRNIKINIRFMENILCVYTVGHGNQSNCQGDSGGPLVLDGKWLVGVSSYTMANCTEPNGFTRLSEYMEWIERHTGISGEPTLDQGCFAGGSGWQALVVAVQLLWAVF